MRKRVIFCVKIATAILLALVFALFSASCEKKERIKVSELPLETLEESLSVGAYKGLVIELNGKSKADAIVERIMADSDVKQYPEGATDYYAEQIKKQYKYYADEAGMTYEQMLNELGETDVTITQEAQGLVKKDMLFALIQAREGISISDGEKSLYFERYVSIYAERYGYTEEYVKAELSDLVYASMLYDKTVEFLIVNNTFSEQGSEG
ncbi:MAG: hypothetical protein IIX30_00260 [Clostridia bacterium]|nr:hypothetical protein [Clostridia bacterium]